MKYVSAETPSNYVCHKCDTTGVKLWRDVVVCASEVDLRCADCLDCGEVDEEGYFEDSLLGKIDQCTTEELGSMLPAVPTEEEDTYWGYTSVPTVGVTWWRNLPNKRKDDSDAGRVSYWRRIRSWF